LLAPGGKKTYLRIRGQFWGRAAPASVILDKNPGALIFVPNLGTVVFRRHATFGGPSHRIK